MNDINEKIGYKLQSSHLYNMEGLFVNSDNAKIVIPDLQREYCWGTVGSLVSDFVSNLITHFTNNKSEELIMGLIYGYYEKERPYLQLCDGQQRLTTLYLLMGMLNLYSLKNEFKDYLISDFELKDDDKEPTLLYAIRDSSLYFLSDLVCHFFIDSDFVSNESPSDYIMSRPWWFVEYNEDPTIKSMLAALNTIQTLIKENFSDDINKISLFGHYVASQLLFIYYDMGGREEGEETFVIINTTGEPLSSTENLKPLVVTNGTENEKIWKKNSAIWEKIDNYFWQYENRAENSDTSDAGMYEFLRIVAALYNPMDAMLEYLSEDKYFFPYKDITVDMIDSVFSVYKSIADNPALKENCDLLNLSGKAIVGKKKTLKDYFVVLPVLAFMLHAKNPSDLDIERVYRLFENMTRYTDINSKSNQIADAILLMEYFKNIANCDVCTLLDDTSIHAKKILSPEERMRLAIYRKNPNCRQQIESIFNNLSSRYSNLLKGRVSNLVKWSGALCSDNFFSIHDFKVITEKFEKIFFNYDQTVSDLTAISYACFANMKDYPVSTNSTNYSFLYHLTDWNERLFSEKSNLSQLASNFGEYLNSLSENNIHESQIMMITNWLNQTSNASSDLYFFIKYFESMNFFNDNQGNIKFNDGFWGRQLCIKDPRFCQIIYSSYNNYRDIYLYGNDWIVSGEKASNWKIINCYNENSYVCLFTDHKKYDIAIDLTLSDDARNGQIYLFNRDDINRKHFDLSKIFELPMFKGSTSERNGRKTVLMPTTEVLANFSEIKDAIDNVLSCKIS